jgi:predicted dehydrogenase
VPTPAIAAWRVRRLLRPSADSSYRRSLRAFVQLIQGRPSRAASLTDGLRSLEAVLAAEDSACAYS